MIILFVGPVTDVGKPEMGHIRSSCRPSMSPVDVSTVTQWRCQVQLARSSCMPSGGNEPMRLLKAIPHPSRRTPFPYILGTQDDEAVSYPRSRGRDIQGRCDVSFEMAASDLQTLFLPHNHRYGDVLSLPNIGTLTGSAVSGLRSRRMSLSSPRCCA